MKLTGKRADLFLALLAALGCSRTEAAAPRTTSSPPPSTSAQQPLGPAMDAAISDRVREAILSDRALRPEAGTVQVTTKNGVVVLTGSVRDESIRRRMDVVVGAVGSVAGVENRLAVDPNPAAAAQPLETIVERMLSDRVRAALLADPALAREATGIRVLTQGGIVSLSGSVSTPSVRDRATIVAGAVGSVVRVENHLTTGGK